MPNVVLVSYYPKKPTKVLFNSGPFYYTATVAVGSKTNEQMIQWKDEAIRADEWQESRREIERWGGERFNRRETL